LVNLKKQTAKKVIILSFVTVVIIALVLRGQGKPVETFTDSTGVKWRVLAEDNDGNRLIITEYVQGMAQYNTVNRYTILCQSDGLRYVLNTWFAYTLAPELRDVAQPVKNVDSDVRTEPTLINNWSRWQTPEAFATENDLSGMTAAGTGEAMSTNALFVLSVSEVNEYVRRGTLNKGGYMYLMTHSRYMPVSWWLRSPGVDNASTIAFVRWFESNRRWHFEAVDATEVLGFRPALWIRSG